MREKGTKDPRPRPRVPDAVYRLRPWRRVLLPEGEETPFFGSRRFIGAGRVLGLFIGALCAASAFAATNEASFTPTSLRKPIREIGLENSTTAATAPLYTCSGSSETACLVDLTNEAALAALFAGPVGVAPGTYDRVYVAHCTTEGSYHAFIRGSMTLGGLAYYTADSTLSDNPLTTLVADQGDVSVEFTGCRTRYVLPTPVTLAAGSSLSISLFVSNVNIAWARLGPITIPSGCRQNPTGTQSVCMAYPDIVPAIGSSTPQLERYYIIENMINPLTVGAQVLLVTDSVTDAVLAGFTRRYFSASSQPPAAQFDTPLKGIGTSSPGVYALESYGSSATDVGYVRFVTFKRRSHIGNYIKPDGTAIPYYAYRDVLSELPVCGPGPFFTTSPVTIDTSVSPAVMPDYSNIVPLGNFNPTGHVFPTDHLYFGLRLVTPGDPLSNTVTSTVYSPGAMWITEITRQTVFYPDATTYTDYTVRFAPCRELAAYFHHLHVLSPALSAAFSAVPLAPEDCQTHATGGNNYETCSVSMKLAVAAGATLATVGGNRNVFAFDLGATDARVPPLAFANPARFPASPLGHDTAHTVCPLDYFSVPVRDLLRGFLGGFDGTPRTAPPVCGGIMQDILGSAQGNWFKPGQPTYPEDPHLALAHDNIVPSIGVFSVGNSVIASGLSGGTYYFTPSGVPGTRVNRDFNAVTPGDIYCYDNLSNWRGGGVLASTVILIQLPDPLTLRIEKRPVANCAALGAPATWSMSSFTVFNR